MVARCDRTGIKYSVQLSGDIMLDMRKEITGAPDNSILHNASIVKDPCIIWSTGPGEQREALCTIERDQFYEMYIRASGNFYQASSDGKKVLSFEINHTHGLGEVPAWRDISAKITEGYLSRLEKDGVALPVIDLIRQNLDLEGALVRFNGFVKQYSGQESNILSAHEVAAGAHAYQTFARPQDTEGLSHIPYMQHPQNIALYAMELSLPAKAVMKSLLHDVDEDTHVNLQALARMFDADVVSGVAELTKSPSQSRASFLAHVSELRGEDAVIKGLDRYDNLIRAFGINDAKYHARILSECTAVYDEILNREPELHSLISNYELLKKELGKYSARQSKS